MCLLGGCFERESSWEFRTKLSFWVEFNSSCAWEEGNSTLLAADSIGEEFNRYFWVLFREWLEFKYPLTVTYDITN